MNFEGVHCRHDHSQAHNDDHDHSHDHSHSTKREYNHRRVRSVLAPVVESSGGSHDHSAEMKLFTMPWEQSLRVIQYHIQRCVILAREGDLDRACYFLKRAQIHCEYTFPGTGRGRITQAFFLREGLCACASSALRAKKWSEAERFSSEGIHVNHDIKQIDMEEVQQESSNLDKMEESGKVDDFVPCEVDRKIIHDEKQRQEGIDVSLGHTFQNDNDLILDLSRLNSVRTLSILAEARLLSIRGAARIRKTEFQLAEKDLQSALDMATSLLSSSLSTLLKLENITVPIKNEIQYLHECINDYKKREAKMARMMMQGDL